jgi:steroid delta-isomerase-like uncharacterized protein
VNRDLASRGGGPRSVAAMDTRTHSDTPQVDTLRISSGEGRGSSTLVTSELIFQAIADRELDALAKLQHEDLVEEFVALGLVLRGRAQVRAFFEELYAAFPDFRIKALTMTAAGTTATTQWESSGTFTGAPFQGIRATGRSVLLRGVDCSVIEDGRIRQDTIYYDGATFARAVGMLPPMGGRGDRLMTAAFNTATRARQLVRRG